MVRNILLVAVSLVFVVIGVLLIANAATTEEAQIGWTSLLFFGGCLAVAAIDALGAIWPARPDEGPDHLHVKTNRLRVGVIGAAAAAWCAVGVLGFGAASFPAVLAWSVTLFGGFIGALCLVLVADGRARIVVDREGIADYRLIGKKIPWDDVHAAKTSIEAGVPIVALWLKDPSAYRDERTRFARVFRRTIDPVQIIDVELAGTVADIQDAIERLAPRRVWGMRIVNPQAR